MQRNTDIGLFTKPSVKEIKKTMHAPFDCEVAILPHAHGSPLFARGETQVTATATLSSYLQQT